MLQEDLVALVGALIKSVGAAMTTTMMMKNNKQTIPNNDDDENENEIERGPEPL